MIEKKTYYFEKPGKTNTNDCIEIVRSTVKDLGYKHIVVATTGGETGLLFSEAFKDTGVKLVAISHSYGFKEPNTIELDPELTIGIRANGAVLYTGTMVTHSLESAFAKQFNGLYPTLIVAQTLRRFGEGPKVCCEIAMMAVDAGLVPEGVDIITVAGTGRGADTAMVVRSAASKRFFDLKVQEIIAKPLFGK